MKKILLVLLTMPLYLCASCSWSTATTVNLATDTKLYKTYGRTYVSGDGLNIDFAGSGIEFEVKSRGEISMEYSCESPVYFQVYIDGEEGERICTEEGSGCLVVIAKNLSYGVHNIRIVRDTDATTSAKLMAVNSITFNGNKKTLKAPADKELYIEFVGDSITAGKYTEMQYGEGDAIHKATNSYAYLTATNLDADYSMVARGGCGYFRVSTCPKTMNMLYTYYNGFKSEPKEYMATRKADIVVLALGTNDSAKNVVESYENGTVPFERFEDALTEQVKQIKKMHGDDVEIILMHGMMSDSWTDEFKAVSSLENTHILKVTKNRDGGRNHPSADGHVVMAKELTEYIQNNIL